MFYLFFTVFTVSHLAVTIALKKDTFGCWEALGRFPMQSTKKQILFINGRECIKCLTFLDYRQTSTSYIASIMELSQRLLAETRDNILYELDVNFGCSFHCASCFAKIKCMQWITLSYMINDLVLHFFLFACSFLMMEWCGKSEGIGAL